MGNERNVIYTCVLQINIIIILASVVEVENRPTLGKGRGWYTSKNRRLRWGREWAAHGLKRTEAPRSTLGVHVCVLGRGHEEAGQWRSFKLHERVVEVICCGLDVFKMKKLLNINNAHHQLTITISCACHLYVRCRRTDLFYIINLS